MFLWELQSHFFLYEPYELCFFLASAEVTVYVEAYSDDNPAFNAPWSPGNPVISVKLGDRRSMGTEILALAARDPLRSGAPVTRFQLLNNDDDLVTMTPDGKLQLNKDLPYDATNQVRTTQRKKVLVLFGIILLVL